MRYRHRRRQGFTLVELLVALALILFIMSILSQAFVTAAQSFNQLKAMGDLAERMRAARTVLTRDLIADHFEGKKRLSQPDFWNNGPPQNGFFRIFQDSTGTVLEGQDLDSISSYRSTKHMLHFTAKLRGNGRSDFLTGGIPNGSPLATFGFPDHRYQDTTGIYTSQWAEVAYFLVATGDNANGTPLYALYRRCRLLVPDPNPNTGTQAADSSNLTLYPLVSMQQPSGTFNSPIDLTVPPRRFGMLTSGNNSAAGVFASSTNTYPRIQDDLASGAISNTLANLSGADLVLTDVVSFDVRVLIVNSAGQLDDDCVDLFSTDVQAFSNKNSAFTATQQVFDTWSQLTDNSTSYLNWSTPGTTFSIPIYQASNGNKIQIKALQVILRCWDYKTSQTRQMTIFQDL